MITLRPLLESDAPLMLEWMHDEELVKALHKDFSSMTIDNCKIDVNTFGKKRKFEAMLDEL